MHNHFCRVQIFFAALTRMGMWKTYLSTEIKRRKGIKNHVIHKVIHVIHNIHGKVKMDLQNICFGKSHEKNKIQQKD